MKLTMDEGNRIVWSDHEDWKTVPGTEKIVDNGRWTLTKEAVFKHTPTGKHYMIWWREGATENQWQEPFEYEEPDPMEVEEKEVMVKQWVPIEEKPNDTQVP